MPTAATDPSLPTEAQDPSPSEPQAVPPIEPGPRARALLTLHDAALSSTLSALPAPTFLACFPLLSTLAPDALRAVHAQMVDRLREAARADFGAILEERGVLGRLNELEVLIGEARGRRERGGGGEGGGECCVSFAMEWSGWGLMGIDGDYGLMLLLCRPHLLPPADLLAAHLGPSLVAAQGRLNAKEQTLESVNAELYEVVKGQWDEIEGLVAGVEGIVRDLESAGGEMSGVERG
ncbi:hypothetical protein VC83_08203 [Pseudogymnoascus destructans]|uniref:MIND kinetochore complex component Nnf1 n=1 Tax=Pseudogymnoascus destructans TaxID=655981 RepID=A0A177A242_9PEZI|nr:uncharacterized protein VC83_08203 [Pseudogymnoascus destructans]OAF55341.1 hypothetical protein VC83_08203 [Pseudogymnoascus destructans]